MVYPHIRFCISKTLDKQMAEEFLGSDVKGGIDFSSAIIESHPGLMQALENPGRRAKINLYVDNYYQINIQKLRETKGYFQAEWDKIEKPFFETSAIYFDNLTWPKGKYVGYLSILPSGPRFLETKTWQTPYLRPEYFRAQVIHELLHFQFHNLLLTMDARHELSWDQAWHLSEIFNDVVQTEPGFVAIQGYKVNVSYPEHKKVHQGYRKIWLKKKNAKAFIKNSAETVKLDYP